MHRDNVTCGRGWNSSYLKEQGTFNLCGKSLSVIHSLLTTNATEWDIFITLNSTQPNTRSSSLFFLNHNYNLIIYQYYVPAWLLIQFYHHTLTLINLDFIGKRKVGV